jgi:hypothetical protein
MNWNRSPRKTKVPALKLAVAAVRAFAFRYSRLTPFHIVATRTFCLPVRKMNGVYDRS